MLKFRFIVTLAALSFFCLSCKKESASADKSLKTVINDYSEREGTIPQKVENIICSGAGCLRYVCYLQGQDKVVAVDDAEKRKSRFNIRPYFLANPQLSALPLFGEFRGRDNPELIVSLKTRPQVILKTYATSGFNPQELQDKTGIPVVTCGYGDLTRYRSTLFESLTLIGKIIGKETRTDECITFFKNAIIDLRKRTSTVSEHEKVSCYIGGISYRGPHGLLSTEPGYASFSMIGAKNVASNPEDGDKQKIHSIIAKEKLIEWDPEIIFIDLATVQLTDNTSALYQLRNDPVFKNIKAVKKGNIYAVLPYNSYATNHEIVIANAYYIGKILFKEQFRDIDPRKKADEIFSFLVGNPVYEQLDTLFQGQIYKKMEL